ncbi:hypothetical protein BJF79_36805 [Actinomadura sp. CNU-125]|uniref:hypothetical protein n=1 Tax=Actinomadura sp. CNU-125 TaxID=1904961 RepID=UPI00095A03EC|nr:hypothetical protein [Actinomadura sp. CNU-125]OLT31570.1 hypothetical protein BJF79_36805 [Actinomadura sp. CNU-125]
MRILPARSPSGKSFRLFNASKSALDDESVPSIRLRLMFGVDIEDFSGRTQKMQADAQRDLERVLIRAADATGIDPRRWRLQPGGDGALIVLPEGIDFGRVVGCLPANIERELARLVRPGRRLRLRLAVHYGFVTSPASSFGPAGDAPVLVARLLDAAPVRRRLAESPDRDLALIVSDRIFRDVVASGMCALRPGDFRRADMVVKGRGYRGHVHEPGG